MSAAEIVLTFSLIGDLPANVRPAAEATVTALRGECGARLAARFNLTPRRLHVVFMPAEAGLLNGVCTRGRVNATTNVGSAVIRLCIPLFNRHDPDTARTILIHEVLHSLGLSEYPVSRDAPSTWQITDAVNEECK